MISTTIDNNDKFNYKFLKDTFNDNNFNDKNFNDNFKRQLASNSKTNFHGTNVNQH